MLPKSHPCSGSSIASNPQSRLDYRLYDMMRVLCGVLHHLFVLQAQLFAPSLLPHASDRPSNTLIILDLPYNTSRQYLRKEKPMAARQWLEDAAIRHVLTDNDSTGVQEPSYIMRNEDVYGDYFGFPWSFNALRHVMF